MKLENMNNAYANKKCTNNIYINNRYAIEVTRKRIKNMYLRVKDTDGTLSVSAPYGMSDTEIRKFVESKSDWIEQTMQEMLVARQLKEQEPVRAPFMEREMRLQLKMQLQRLIDKWEPVMGVKSAGITIKKMIAKSHPKGICWKTAGSVINISGGPLATSSWKATTAGMTTMPARSAAQVSKKATFLAQPTSSISFFK